MKNNLLFLIAVLLMVNIGKSQNLTSDYIALTTPQQYDAEIYFLNENKRVEVKNINDLTHDHTILSSFSNLVSTVTVYDMDSKGGLDVMGVGISVKDKRYQVIYDFSQTQTLISDDNDQYESILVGVGVRMVAKIRTTKGGINLSSLIGLVADMNSIEGSLEVRVNGIGSKKINSLVPTTSDLSPSSISTALQAIASIKSHIYDKDTIITPQLIAYSKRDQDLKAEIANKKIN